MFSAIGVARDVGKMCKCTPGHEVQHPEEESIFRTFLLGGLDLEVYLDRFFEGDD